MNSENQPVKGLNAIWLIKLAIKWKRPLLITLISSLVISFFITMPAIMKPLYKSTAVIYPVNMSTYSKETPTEQMVQLLNSDEIKDKLIHAFNLYTYYKIDSTGSTHRFDMMKRLQDNISINKTPLESIEIAVLDVNPLTAAAMCDSILKFADDVALQILHERSIEAANATYLQVTQLKTQLDSLDSAMHYLQVNYGILDFEQELTGFSREYYRKRADGNVNAQMETMKKNLEEKGSAFVSLREHAWRLRGVFGETKAKYDQQIADSKKIISFHNLVTAPVPADKKEYPKRGLIMIMFSLAAVLTAFIVIIYLEHYHPQLKSALHEG